MTPQVGSIGGYHFVGLTCYGRKKRFSIHRLVLEAFVGPCPEGMEGCHNDGNPTHNTPDNLRWDTRAANARDRKKHGTDFGTNKTHCKWGHVLSIPNLAKSNLRQGDRACLSCSRGRAYDRNVMSQEPSKETADHYYDQIMNTAAIAA